MIKERAEIKNEHLWRVCPLISSSRKQLTELTGALAVIHYGAQSRRVSPLQ